MRKALFIVAIVCGVSAFAAEQKPGWFGFGITLNQSPGAPAAKWLYVRALDPDGPAIAAGLRVADIITAIDGKPVAFSTNAEVLRFFGHAKPGTTIRLSVIRQQTPLTITIRALPFPDKYAARRSANQRYAQEHDAKH